jgi:hypothetical protein
MSESVGISDICSGGGAPQLTRDLLLRAAQRMRCDKSALLISTSIGIGIGSMGAGMDSRMKQLTLST